jgi:hypothetical protein
MKARLVGLALCAGRDRTIKLRDDKAGLTLLRRTNSVKKNRGSLNNRTALVQAGCVKYKQMMHFFARMPQFFHLSMIARCA